jgi:hypothetical protein
MPTYEDARYRADVVGQRFIESSIKGTPGFELQLKILGRYGPGDELLECPQYERTYTQYLSNEIGVNILKDDLQALGVEFSDFAQLDPAKPGAINLVGRQVDVRCKIENREGREQERWSIARSRKPLGQDAVQQLNLRFGHLLRPGGTSAPPPPPVAPNPSDDPF